MNEIIKILEDLTESNDEYDYFEIQSEINNDYGAIIWPIRSNNVIRKIADGYCLKRFSDDKHFSPKELREIAGDEITDELLSECKKLHSGGIYE